VIVSPAPRRPASGGGLAVLVVATVLASLAAPHATALRGLVADALPVIAAPAPPSARPASGSRPARAVAFALRQRGKPYQWGAQGPGAYDCSGLTWAAWRAAGVTIPRTAAGQLAGLPRVQPGDLVIYASRARRGGMWRWSSARVGWSRPPAAASPSAPPAFAPAGWGPSDRVAADDGRRLSGLPRLGAVDRG
jgi:peptidoglycan DL-endopeptidase CwlO